MTMKTDSSIKFAFVSLGCDKNTVDSEIMLRLLTDHGYELVKEEDQAEVIVINTCAFILDAQEESINTILELAQYKETGALKALVVTGCLAERYSKEIFEEMPEVDAVVGTGSYEEIVEVVDELMKKGGKVLRKKALEQRDLGYYGRIYSTPGYYEFLKIAEGCNNHCTYCIIPQLRGPYRSRAAEDILREARDMAEEGVKEIMLVAQDVTKYASDIPEGTPGRLSLGELLHRLCEIDGIKWIRLLYCYPEYISDELIEAVKTEDKILNYFDMPIQHAADRVLKRMGRHMTNEELRAIVAKLRREISDVCLRTTLITGFPGETEEEFEELYRFVEETRFDRLGVFPYSQEDGTPAAKLPDQLPDEVKEERKNRILALQKEISSSISDSFVGAELTALIEGQIPGEEGYVYSARTYRDAPDIDGFLFVTSDRPLRSGDLVKARVTGSFEYDLIGELISVEEEEVL